MWKKIAGGAVAGVALFGASSLGAANYLVSKIVEPTAPNQAEKYNFTPYELDSEYEEVLFPTANGRLLSGWYLPRFGENRVIITVHGHRGRKEDMLGISTFLWKAGFNVLMFDCRGHGLERRSDEIITLGHGELEDFLAAVAFVRTRFAEEGSRKPIIGALGGSLGAAVALVGASKDPDIRAVWADSSFTSRQEVIAHNWTATTHLPERPVMDLANLMFKFRTGKTLVDFSPLAEISKMTPRPIFFVHALDDATTPVSHVHRLYDAAPGPKELWLEDGIGHCGIYFKYRKEYRQRAIEFFKTWSQ
jgi:fermentation-respiration switch protein FrsA (DUF1100 family)